LKKLPKYFYISLTIITGALFLYSAYTKLFPIQSFEYTITGSLHIPSTIAAIAARFFTGIEAGLGALIILHIFGKHKWVLKSAFLLLVVFSLYLAWLWIKEGNNVNCGCFGDAIWMSPATSLIKNAVLLVVTGLLISSHRGIPYKWAHLSAPVFLISVLAAIYIFIPTFTRYKLDFTPIYADKNNGPSIDLTKGKHIIAFLSPSCIHCRRAAAKIHKMEQNDQSLPIYMIIGGATSDLTDFWKASNAQNDPHSRLDTKPFMKYTGGVFPTILWVDNGWVEANTNYTDLDQVVIKKWMK
jgi:hypothetical protein